MEDKGNRSFQDAVLKSNAESISSITDILRLFRDWAEVIQKRLEMIEKELNMLTKRVNSFGEDTKIE